MKQQQYLLSFGICLFILASCGDKPQMKNTSSEKEDADANPVTEMQVPPKNYYDSAVADEFELLFTGKANDEDRDNEIIFLNFNGASLLKNQSFLICGDKALIPPAAIAAERIDKIKEIVQKYLSAYSDKIKVVTSKPLGGKFSTILVGGLPSLLGCDGGGDLKMRVPFDVEGLKRDDVAFIFSQLIDTDDELVTKIETAAEFILGIADGVQNFDFAKRFIVSKIEDLSGSEELQAFSQLLWEMSKDDVIDLKPFYPYLKRIVPGGLKYIEGLDRVLSAIIGVSQGDDQLDDGKNPSNSQYPRLQKLKEIFSSIQENADGSAADAISAIAVLTGRPEIAAAAQAVKTIILATQPDKIDSKTADNKSDSASVDKKASNEKPLPDLTNILALSAPNLTKMLADLRGYVQYVNEGYEGDTKKALLALVAVSYAQLYQSYQGVK